LSRKATGHTLYILDEPTTGLHFHDVAKLLDVLFKLRNTGNTLLIIEHNLDVIKTADWVIDWGRKAAPAAAASWPKARRKKSPARREPHRPISAAHRRWTNSATAAVTAFSLVLKRPNLTALSTNFSSSFRFVCTGQR
jgi:energy-coupling factor transporter ATP-binding protein EcfA2